MYKEYIENSYNGIKGITILDSGVPGENFGVLALVHGNEEVGLEIFDYLKKNIRLLSGKIYMIAVNIKAYEEYIKGFDPVSCRFLDHNMNRIHGKKFIQESYEFNRKKELEPILDKLDVVIDLHSSTGTCDSIGITDYKLIDKMQEIFDVEHIVVDDLSSCGALLGYTMEQGTPSFAVECCVQGTEKSFETARNNVLNLMSYYDFINEPLVKNMRLSGKYKFLEEIKPTYKDFEYVRKFREFDKLDKLDIYAEDKNKKFVNNYDKAVYIGILPTAPTVGMSNAGFLFEKI